MKIEEAIDGSSCLTSPRELAKTGMEWMPHSISDFLWNAMKPVLMLIGDIKHWLDSHQHLKIL